MLDKTRWYLRKAVFNTYRYLKHPRRLKASPLKRWFARHFLDKHVWRPTQSTFAGGSALGFLVTIQLFPGQLPVGVLLAAILRVNIPTVIIFCLASNPVTFAPIAFIEKQFGDWIMPYLGASLAQLIEHCTLSLLSFLTWMNTSMPAWITIPVPEKGVRWIASMFIGGILLGILGAPLVYAISWLSWKGVAKLLRIPIHRRPHTRKNLPIATSD